MAHDDLRLQESELSFHTFKSSFQIPTAFDKQGAQLLAVAFLVVSRTWISDRIASLNGIFLSLIQSFYVEDHAVIEVY